jgi:hypothetical protein
LNTSSGIEIEAFIWLVQLLGTLLTIERP